MTSWSCRTPKLFYVVSAMAPMGFSLPLYFAQRTSEHLFAESLGQGSSLFNDQNAPLIMDPRPSSRLKTNHGVYVDNLGLLFFDVGTVGTKLSKAADDFTSVGLELHETATGSGDREALGTVLSCESFHLRLTSSSAVCHSSTPAS